MTKFIVGPSSSRIVQSDRPFLEGPMPSIDYDPAKVLADFETIEEAKKRIKRKIRLLENGSAYAKELGRKLKQGRLCVRKCGRRKIILKSDLMNWLNSLPEAT